MRAASILAFECAAHGRWPEATRHALAAFAEDPDDVDALEIAARASVARADLVLAPSTAAEQLVSEMAAVIHWGAGAEREYNALMRTGIGLCGSPTADGILGFLARESSSDPAPRGVAVLRGAVAIPTLHPLRSAYVPDACGQAFLARMLELGGASAWYASHCLGQPGIPAPEGLDSDLGTIVAAEVAFGAGHYADALEAATALVGAGAAASRTRALRLIPHCHLRLGDVEAAVRSIAQVHLDTPQLDGVMAHGEVAAEVTPSVKRQMKSDLALPIFWDIVATNADARKEYERRYASEDLIAAHALSRPSELGGIADRFDRAALVYFLRDVCTEPVISTYRVFNKSREAAEERIQICHALSELDPANAEDYQSEVTDLLRRLEIQRRLGEVDQSRIYIDRAGVLRTARTALRENFSRYTAFVRSGLNADIEDHAPSDPPQAAEHRDAQGEGDSEPPASREITDLERTLPRNERRALVLTMLDQVRREYALSTQHGLNKYLSSRVRHVALAGQMRKALDDQSLITEFDAAAGCYAPNEEWTGGVENPEVKRRIEECFDRFARGFDELITTINREWLQVRTEPEEPGMFDFPLNLAWVNRYEALIEREHTLDQFLDIVLTQFDLVLEHNLAQIRNRFEGEVRERVDDLIREFQKGVDGIPEYDGRRELGAAIQLAGTELQNNIGRVAAWFRTPSPISNEPFPIEDAIQIGVVAVPAGRRTFSASVVAVEGEPVTIEGILFQFYVDVLTTMFANMIRYSGQDEVNARISIWHLGNRIRLRVENDIAGGVSDVARARVDAIRQKLVERQLALSAVSEGGTGLLKIASYLDHLGSYSRSLTFGFLGEDGFFVEFEIATAVST